MAEYINIKGQSIEVVASDPANPTIGQIWYNSTSNTLKGGGFQAAAWATGGNMNTARYYIAGCGIQTAALGFGGYTSPPATDRSETEEYNGSAWTAGGSLNTARNGLAGAGTQTAGLAFGGSPAGGATEEYDGTNWATSPGSLNTARYILGGIGIQTAALAFGGLLPPNAATGANRRI
jgi:hypothetical protein